MTPDDSPSHALPTDGSRHPPRGTPGRRPVVVGLGEVLWDVFPDGAHFGGAPANVAFHAAAMGAQAWIVSRVGADDLGRRAMKVMHDHGVGTDYIQRADHRPTGTVQVEVDGQGQPRYRIAEGVAWDELAWSDALPALASRADAVCFGTLAQRSGRTRETIDRFLEHTRRGCLRVLDVNLRGRFYDDQRIRHSLGMANVLKLSDEEMPVVAAACGWGGDEREVLHRLLDRYALRLVALTRGARGARLLAGDEACDVSADPVEVCDTVGAGDAFTAALVLGFLDGRRLEAIGRACCRVAGYVCTQAGAVPALPDDLKAAVRAGE